MFVPMLFMPLSWWIVPESIRWLISKDNRKAATATITQVASFNGVQLSETQKKDVDEFLRYQDPVGNVSVWNLLKKPRLRKHFFALCVLLVTIRLLYDAHVRITQFLEYNLFVTFSVASALECFSGFAAYILADKWGRRSSLVFMFATSSVIELVRAISGSGEAERNLQLSLHFLGKFTITTAINVAFMMPVEVLPTVARSQASSIIHTIGFAIAFVSPFIVHWAESCRQCALLVLCIVAAVGALTCLLLLPETLDMDLPDTLQEGEDFARGQPRFPCCSRQHKNEDRYRVEEEEKGKHKVVLSGSKGSYIGRSSSKVGIKVQLSELDIRNGSFISGLNI